MGEAEKGTTRNAIILEVSFDLSAKLRSKPRVNEITSFCDALKEL